MDESEAFRPRAEDPQTAMPSMHTRNALEPRVTEEPLDIEAIVGSFGELSTVAPVAMRVIEMVDDEDVTINQLADVIARDPGLASRLLRLANSAAYSRGQPVTNLARAAMLIGLRTLKLVTLGFSLVDTTADRAPINGALIWRRSLATAALARRFAPILAAELAEDAFAAGLLSNVGKTALLDQPRYTTAAEANGPWLTPDDERVILGFTSDELTARILDNWGLPGIFGEAIWTRHPEDLDAPTTELGSLLRLADIGATLVLADQPDDLARALDAATLAAAHLGMTIDELERVIATSGPELDELTGTFELQAIGTDEVEEIIRSAQSRLAQISFDMASQLSEERMRNDELVVTNQELAAAAATDALTGLPNRRTFDAFLGNQIALRARHRRDTSLGLILVDLDHFKAVNDTHGHAVGDEVLAEFGHRLSNSSRRGELAARTGGEEFALVLPDTDAEELRGAAERIRHLLDGNPIETAAGPLPITASVGAAWVDSIEMGGERLLYETADAALYQSKESGRNRVTLAPMA